MTTWHVANRQEGKTSRLIEWVKQGEKTNTYPYWTRVIITHSLSSAQLLRHGGNKWGLDYQQVFSLQEWQKLVQGRYLDDIELGLDNVDLMLHALLGVGGQIVRATATGEPV